jgi:hypothetical protein
MVIMASSAGSASAEAEPVAEAPAPAEAPALGAMVASAAADSVGVLTDSELLGSAPELQAVAPVRTAASIRADIP